MNKTPSQTPASSSHDDFADRVDGSRSSRLPTRTRPEALIHLATAEGPLPLRAHPQVGRLFLQATPLPPGSGAFSRSAPGRWSRRAILAHRETGRTTRVSLVQRAWIPLPHLVDQTGYSGADEGVESKARILVLAEYVDGAPGSLELV